jgi:hypothetical protein
MEPRAITAVAPFAYTDDKAPFDSLVGQGAKPGSGDHPTLDDLPITAYFDPHGYNIRPLSGQSVWDDSTTKALGAGISASVTKACSGSLGISAGSAKTDNATVQATETLALDPSQRRYLPQLKACCENYNSWSCSNWIVNRAFKTKTTWTVKSDSNIGANGAVSCGNAAPAPVSVDGGTPTAALSMTDGGLVAAAAQTGVSAEVNLNAADHHSAEMISEGWNVVEVAPLKQICAEWQSIKQQYCTGATEVLKRQLLCDQ